MSRHALIVGAGPGLALENARRLGAAGHELHLVARSAQRLAGMADTLADEGITATAHVGDVARHAELTRLVRLIDDQAPLDVCVFQPGVREDHLVDVLELTPRSFRPDLEMLPLGAAAVGEALIPAMRERGRGTFVCVGGASARLSLRDFGNHGPAGAALRSYALTLASALAGSGVHVSFLAIGGMIGTDGPQAIPAGRIAERLVKLIHDNDVRELILTPEGEIVPRGAK